MTLTYDEFAQYVWVDTLIVPINEEGRDYADNQETIPAPDDPHLFGDADSPFDAASFRSMERNDIQRTQLSAAFHALSISDVYPCPRKAPFKEWTIRLQTSL